MLLAIDTSTQRIGGALYDGVQVLFETVWISNNRHTTDLAPAIADMLAKAQLKASDLQAVAVALGPGSFTGLRIGLALAKGLALAHHIPVIGIPTLDALAVAQPVTAGAMAAVLKAGRGRLAVSWYEAAGQTWKSLNKIECFTPQELVQVIERPTVVCGELTEEERRLMSRKRKTIQLASPAQSLRRPGYLAELGWQRLQAGNPDDPATISPIYLHYNDPIPG